MFETIRELWHDYVCLHHSDKTQQAVKKVRDANCKFDQANVKLEGAVMDLILNRHNGIKKPENKNRDTQSNGQL